jgi:hypothetical protein
VRYTCVSFSLFPVFVYATDIDFKDTYENCREGRTWNKYMLQDGILYRANKLCVPASFIRLLFLQETYGGGLMGHFGVKKTEDVLTAHLFWSKIRCDVERYVSRCTTYNMVFICLFLFLVCLERIFLWTLS